MGTVAFFGLGNMGGCMAKNVLSAGHRVQGFDVSASAVKAFISYGGTPASTPQEAVSGADVVVTMLPSGKQVMDVYIDQGVLLSIPRDALLIDCSTIDVPTARRVNSIAAAQGIKMVDAPVSGGVAAAAAGTLTFMVGGTEFAFKAARPYLESMGKAIIHAGPAGNGQAAKICNNMLLGISMIGTAEAFTLGESLGLEPKTLFEISSQATGQCWSMTSYCPVPGIVATAPSNRDYKPGFAASMMLKDLRLAQDAARSAASVTPLGRAAAEVYEAFVTQGNGDLDFSAIIRAVGRD